MLVSRTENTEDFLKMGPHGGRQTVDAKNHTSCDLRFRSMEMIQPKKEPSNDHAQSKEHKDLVTRENLRPR